MSSQMKTPGAGGRSGAKTTNSCTDSVEGSAVLRKYQEVSAHPGASIKQAAARLIGAILREARGMASANLESGPRAVKVSAKRLRMALDSLTKLWGAP